MRIKYTILFAILLLLPTQVPPVKSATHIDVIVAMDEEWVAYVYVGFVNPEAMAILVVNHIQEYYSNFNIVFNVEYAYYDSDDSTNDPVQRTREAHYEISHEGKMLWALTAQTLEGAYGQAIPHLHVMIAKWTHPSQPKFERICLHEVGHLFNLEHCVYSCTMNPGIALSRFVWGYCEMHIYEVNFWKNHWQDIQPWVNSYYSGSGGGYPCTHT